MSLLVDVHTHLDHRDFEKDLPDVIDRAKKAGVNIIINNGLNHETNLKTLELAKKYAVVRAALGIYPTEGILMNQSKLQEEIDFIRKNKDKIVAVGEIGVDRKYVKDKDKEQADVFSRMLELADEIKKPSIIHTREAEEMVVDILSEYKARKVVLHCFTGSIDLAKKAEKLGYYFSIPPRLVHSETFQKLVEAVDINQLLTETDAPFLGPVKDERNEPAFVVETIKKIAEIKKLDASEVENNIFMNYQKVF